MHTSKKPSAMPIVQPHQNKFRVLLLIAQLMVQKLFLGAHFKIHFGWLSSLDVSIRTLLSFPLPSMSCSVTSVASSCGGTSTRLSLKIFSYSFSHIEYYHFEMHTSKKPSVMPIVQPHQNKFRVFLLIAHNWWSKNYFWVRISKYPSARLLKLLNFWPNCSAHHPFYVCATSTLWRP